MTTAKNKQAKPAAKAPKQQRSIPWLGIAFGVIAVALVGAIVFSSSDPLGSEFGTVEVSGDSLAPYTGNGVDAAIGSLAPEIVGADFDGNPVEVLHDGRAKAVIFLAHWCPHCQVEVPRVQAWLDSGGGVEGVDLVSVATSMNSAQPNFPPSEWLDREGWTVPVIADDKDFAALRAYGSGGFPYYVFLDKNGDVVRRSSGELDIQTLQAFMQEAANA